MPASHSKKALKKLLLKYGTNKTVWPKENRKQFQAAQQNSTLRTVWQSEAMLENWLEAAFKKEAQAIKDTLSPALKARVLEQAEGLNKKSLKKQWQEFWNSLFPKHSWYWPAASCLSIVFLLFYMQLSLSQSLETNFLEKQDFTTEVEYFLGVPLKNAGASSSKTTPTFSPLKEKK